MPPKAVTLSHHRVIEIFSRAVLHPEFLHHAPGLQRAALFGRFGGSGDVERCTNRTYRTYGTYMFAAGRLVELTKV